MLSSHYSSFPFKMPSLRLSMVSSCSIPQTAFLVHQSFTSVLSECQAVITDRLYVVSFYRSVTHTTPASLSMQSRILSCLVPEIVPPPLSVISAPAGSRSTVHVFFSLILKASGELLPRSCRRQADSFWHLFCLF